MTEARIRRLTCDDQASFHAMRALFGEVFDDLETYTSKPPEADYVSTLLRDDTFIALVADIGGDLVGAIAAYELRKFEQCRSEIYIYDLAVRAAHRRRGIATALIHEIRHIAHERGAWTVFVQADDDDAQAQALYDKFGSREEVLHFDLTPIERR